jgi:uncharacterized protein YegL
MITLIKYCIFITIIVQSCNLFKIIQLKNKLDNTYKNKKYWRPVIFIGFLGLMIFNIPFTLLLIIFIGFIKKVMEKKREKKRKNIIGYYGYKIFKFLMNQTSSGIKVSDALQALYRIVKDKELRKQLIKVSACYGQTANLHESLNHLKLKYKGVEVDTLCVAIEQGIDTGTNYETLVKMEGLLFKKYLFQIKQDTVLRKKRGVLAALYLCIIVVLMVGIPILMDMVSAFNKIFY